MILSLSTGFHSHMFRDLVASRNENAAKQLDWKSPGVIPFRETGGRPERIRLQVYTDKNSLSNEKRIGGNNLCVKGKSATRYGGGG
jgi:hypothetical protein